jgi:hypothetical protein
MNMICDLVSSLARSERAGAASEHTAAAANGSVQ